MDNEELYAVSCQPENFRGRHSGQLIFSAPFFYRSMIQEDIPGMQETPHIEWKESWRDEYLKWICGFADAEGKGRAVLCAADENQMGQLQP